MVKLKLEILRLARAPNMV